MGARPKPKPERGRLLAYVIGLALGDGNLSWNGRSTRLRITCDARYPQLAGRIIQALQQLLPHNRVSIVRKKGRCFDISCHSKHWEDLLGWEVGKGSKSAQQVTVPDWIRQCDHYMINCLRGLLETDGSVYSDRGYPMVMFVGAASTLAQDVFEMISHLGFVPHIYRIQSENRPQVVYHVRLSKRVPEFLQLIELEKG